MRSTYFAGQPLRRKSLAISAVLALVLTVGTVVSPAQADPIEPTPTAGPTRIDPSKQAPSTTPSSADPDSRIAESLQYLMTTYKIDKAEAKRRLDLQDRAVEMADAVRAEVKDELLDVWLDQEGGGKLTFLTSEPNRAAQALSKHAMADQTKINKSKFTYGQLKEAERKVKEQLSGIPEATIGIDRRSERVAVRYETGPARTRAAEVRKNAGVTAGAVPVNVDTPPPSPEGEERACDVLACDTPMRGGLRLHVKRDAGTFGSCTSGFNIRGSNGWIYLLTAGHCVTTPGAGRQCMYHNGLPVVWEKAASGTESNCTGTPDSRYFRNQHDFDVVDYAILPYSTEGHSWASYWIGNRNRQNLVQAQCVTPSVDPCTNGSYAIGGLYNWNQIQTGWVVCATGTGKSDVYWETVPSTYKQGTRCGEIQSKNWVGYSVNQTSPQAQGLKVNICSRNGDSGGPLFGQQSGFAYGILSGGPPRGNVECDMANSQEFGVYSPIQGDGAEFPGILDVASAMTGITMSLITTSS